MILNRLSRIDGLSIIARNSSFALPTKNIDSSEIGRRPQFRISDRWQRAARGGSAAGGRAPRGYGRRYSDLVGHILIAVCTISSVSRMRSPIKSPTRCRCDSERAHQPPAGCPAARIWRLISPSCSGPDLARPLHRRRVGCRSAVFCSGRLRWIPIFAARLRFIVRREDAGGRSTPRGFEAGQAALPLL